MLQFILLNEQELMQQRKQGSEPAFRWLVVNYRNRVFHTVLNILQDCKDEKDVAKFSVPEKNIHWYLENFISEIW